MRDGFAVCWSVVQVIILYLIHCILRVLRRSHVLGAMANGSTSTRNSRGIASGSTRARNCRRKKKKKKDIAGEDYCQHLPEDLLVVIFSKLVVHSSISDLKFLFRCSLVSRRFNSMISTTASSIQSLSLTNAAEIKKKILIKIMGKFHNLRSFYIEYNDLGSGIKWKAVYRSGIYCFVALQSGSKWNNYFYQDLANYFYQDLARSKRICAMVKFHEKMMVLFLRRHKMLSSVVMADSNKQGKISFGDELLKEWRTNRNYNNNYALRRPQQIQTGCVPLFGSSRKPVEILIIKSDLTDVYIDEDRYAENWSLDDIMNWDFDDEEKAFGEALTLILRDHKHRIGMISASAKISRDPPRKYYSRGFDNF